MSPRRFRLIMLGILGLCIISFLLIFFAGLSLLKTKSQEMVDLKLKNKTADAQLTNLAISKKDIEKYSYFKDIARTVIPNDKNQAQAVLDIFQLAQESGISIQSITFPTSNLGLRAPTSSAAPAAGADATSAAASKAISQATPVTGIPGLYAVQLIISPASGPNVPPAQQVTYAKMLGFLSRIENNRRTAPIAQVNIQTGNSTQPNSTSNSQLNFSLITNIFIKP
jgi:hypothetical protein